MAHSLGKTHVSSWLTLLVKHMSVCCSFSYPSVLSKLEFFIKMRAACLLSPSFITQGRMGARKAALILMKNSHFDRTPQYQIWRGVDSQVFYFAKTNPEVAATCTSGTGMRESRRLCSDTDQPFLTFKEKTRENQ